MANWEKLNKEFEDALDSMTDEKWTEFKNHIDKKRAEKPALNLQNVSNSLLSLDGKTVPTTFHVSKFVPKINID